MKEQNRKKKDKEEMKNRRDEERKVEQEERKKGREENQNFNWFFFDLFIILAPKMTLTSTLNRRKTALTFGSEKNLFF